MTPGMKIATAVVGGYVLGRKKKAKVAITMGAWLVGKKLNLDPKKLLSDFTRELGSSPELAGVRDQLRDEVLGAGRNLATGILTHQAGRLADSLQGHTDSLRDKAVGHLEEATPSDDEAPADEVSEDQAPEDDRKPVRKRSGGSPASSATTRKRSSSSGTARKPQKRTANRAEANRG
ncbi:hypothetical protein [Amycolatopsis jiangsuensis]|uniref:DNA primase n=1 Tax=Amycolatopsis jiangsuensis TaxID=1181879 RepID=A0A840IWK6_9PSEU|nr:hypothetical protein [Amycolatopsis jiangsuensis]MBB4686240.1 hypothetical protein [Amycolatopsis jiangsuensis]